MPLPAYLTEIPRPKPAKHLVRELLRNFNTAKATTAGRTITIQGLTLPQNAAHDDALADFIRGCTLGSYTVDVVVAHVNTDLENALASRGFTRIMEDQNHPTWGHHILWRLKSKNRVFSVDAS